MEETWDSYSDIDGRVDAKWGVFGREGSPGSLHHHPVPCADVAIGDELVVEAALCACVIGLTDGEEIRCQAARHHLPSVHKDVCRKQAKREHACGGKMPAHSFSLAAINQDLTNTAKQIRDSWKHICRSSVSPPPPPTPPNPPWIFLFPL